MSETKTGSPIGALFDEADKLPPNNPIARKLSKLSELRLENDKETLEALKSLSEFFTENNIRTRRNLRGNLEKKSLTINEEFLQSFGDVKDSLNALCKDISSMNLTCKDMVDNLKVTKGQTSDLISQMAKLKTEARRLDVQRQVSLAFLGAFQLTPEELQALRGGRDQTIDERFFAALSRARRIHEDCKLLLRSHRGTAGLQMMEAMASHQEAAYERLYRWLQGQWRLLAAEASDCSPTLAQGLASLEDRPVLLAYSLDEYANARRASVVRNFIDALTRGGPGGPGGRAHPIESHSRDPLRYVGDMLAWVHQCAAAEREMLAQLVSRCRAVKVDATLSRIAEGLCAPLRLRVEQVAVTQLGPLVLYRLRGLLRFYRSSSLPGGPLAECLDDLATLADKMFANSLTCHCAALLEKRELPPGDLGAPVVLERLVSLVREVLSCRDGSLAPLEDRRRDVPSLLQQVLEPALEACEQSATRLSSADCAAHLCNCLYLAHCTLAPFELTEPWLERLAQQQELQLQVLVQEQLALLLSQLGLATLARVMGDPTTRGPLSTLAGCDTLAVQSCADRLSLFLTQRESFPLPQAQLLSSAGHRTELRKRALNALCALYTDIYAAVHDPANGYPEPDLLLPRSPREVQDALLGGPSTGPTIVTCQ